MDRDQVIDVLKNELCGLRPVERAKVPAATDAFDQLSLRRFMEAEEARSRNCRRLHGLQHESFVQRPVVREADELMYSGSRACEQGARAFRQGIDVDHPMNAPAALPFGPTMVPPVIPSIQPASSACSSRIPIGPRVPSCFVKFFSRPRRATDRGTLSTWVPDHHPIGTVT